MLSRTLHLSVHLFYTQLVIHMQSLHGPASLAQLTYGQYGSSNEVADVFVCCEKFQLHKLLIMISIMFN